LWLTRALQHALLMRVRHHLAVLASALPGIGLAINGRSAS